MRCLSSWLAAALLSTVIASCGHDASQPSSSTAQHLSGKVAATTTSKVAKPGGYLHDDGDLDPDDDVRRAKIQNDDGSLFATYGKVASPTDKQAVSSLIKRYLTASTTGDNKTACALIDTALAQGLTEDHGTAVQSRHRTCSEAVSPIFEQQRLTSTDVATMSVISVHVKGRIGLAVLGFKAVPEQELAVERDGHAWKVDAFLSSDLT